VLALKFGSLAVGVFIALAVAWWAVQWLVFGDSECDRGKCGPMGEFAESAGWFLPLGFAAIALVTSWAAVLRRSATRPPSLD
jgi:hypothetical protein